MRWLLRLLRRWRLLMHRKAAEQSMDEELRHHIESEIAERIHNGMSPAEARRTALSDFGSIEAVKEDARDARGLRSIEDLMLDLRYAVRVLAHDSGFTLAALTTFALEGRRRHGDLQPRVRHPSSTAALLSSRAAGNALGAQCPSRCGTERRLARQLRSMARARSQLRDDGRPRAHVGDSHHRSGSAAGRRRRRHAGSLGCWVCDLSSAATSPQPTRSKAPA